MTPPEGGIIDVDFWALKATARHVARYLSPTRSEWMRIDEPSPAEIFPESRYFIPGERLAQAATADDPQGLARAYLDEQGIVCAVLNPGAAGSVAGYASAGLAAEMARGVNDWMSAEWLSADSRLRGSIVVSARDAGAAADEIRRVGASGRMAQVLFAYPPHLLGHRALDPIYEASCELGLPVLLEAGGAYSGANGGLTTIGHPTSLLDAFVGWESAAQPHLVSAIVEGTFDRFPELRMIFSGFGIAWLPSLLWRLDHEIRSGRTGPPPALEKLPSEYVRDHVRFTTSVLELPADPRPFVDLLDSIGGERLVLYGSGAIGGADGRALLERVDDGWRARIERQNALELYALWS